MLLIAVKERLIVDLIEEASELGSLLNRMNLSDLVNRESAFMATIIFTYSSFHWWVWVLI